VSRTGLTQDINQATGRATWQSTLYSWKRQRIFLISNFRRVLNVLCFLLGDFPASEFYMPTFRNTLFHLHRQIGACRMN